MLHGVDNWFDKLYCHMLCPEELFCYNRDIILCCAELGMIIVFAR